MFKTIEKHGHIEIQEDADSGQTRLQRATSLTCGVDLGDWKSIIRAALNVECTADELIGILEKRYPASKE